MYLIVSCFALSNIFQPLPRSFDVYISDPFVRFPLASPIQSNATSIFFSFILLDRIALSETQKKNEVVKCLTTSTDRTTKSKKK